MVTEKQLKTLNKYVDTIHELLIDQITNHGTARQMTTNRSIFVRMFGQLLYEAPKIHTGMVSVRLVERKLKNFSAKVCMEHHHSRQRGGEALVSLIEEALITGALPTKQQVREIALVHCQVHYTTPEENAALRRHQRRCSSEAAYRRANITLIEARDLFSKRGRHAQTWKQQMIAKYQPIVNEYNSPPPPCDNIPPRPQIVN